MVFLLVFLMVLSFNDVNDFVWLSFLELFGLFFLESFLMVYFFVAFDRWFSRGFRCFLKKMSL